MSQRELRKLLEKDTDVGQVAITLKEVADVN